MKERKGGECTRDGQNYPVSQLSQSVLSFCPMQPTHLKSDSLVMALNARFPGNHLGFSR